ncbi:hypothetical protein K3495_g10781 [Podosphaera aphanis]|nr:hypothetical protein K3495_g10781 [Podosphaera aphanis]
MNQTSIAKQLGISRNQVRYTFCTPYIGPKKAAGRPPTLSPADVVRIEAFITYHPLKVVECHGLNLAMAPFGILEGHGRYPALKKPPLSEEVKRKRREWAEAHKDWTVEDWMAIFWTVETWATDGQHKRDWVTRKVGILVPQVMKNTDPTLSSR